MPRQRSPERDKAFEVYKEHKGKIANREIAKQLDIPEKSISGWKVKDKWDEQINGVLQKKKQSTPKRLSEEKSKDGNLIQLNDNGTNATELTGKQILFVAEYLIDLNATQAAIRAGYSEKNAGKIGPELLGKSRVRQAIEMGMSRREHRIGITADKVLEQLAKIGFADIKNVVSWSGNRIKMKPSDDVDGTILAEITETETESGGTLKVKLNDRMKALEMMGRHLNLFNDRHKQRIEDEKLKIDQGKFEIEKLKSIGGVSDAVIDEHNKMIMTLSQLLNNPVPNRNIEDFEEDDEPGDQSND
ncbi:MAG TPA: terminase small subunit [Desulfosporosinus sp.]|nr:terminase small subunit [Desulfosporosinus sp.]